MGNDISIEEILKIIKKNKILIVLIFLSLIVLFTIPKIFMAKDNELPEVKLKEMKDNKTFAIMIPNDNGDGYKLYEGSEMFPYGYVLNIDKSYCIDMNGQIIEGALKKGDGRNVTVNTSQTAYCTLFFENAVATILTYDNTRKNKTDCVTVQCALDELYTMTY